MVAVKSTLFPALPACPGFRDVTGAGWQTQAAAAQSFPRIVRRVPREVCPTYVPGGLITACASAMRGMPRCSATTYQYGKLPGVAGNAHGGEGTRVGCHLAALLEKRGRRALDSVELCLGARHYL